MGQPLLKQSEIEELLKMLKYALDKDVVFPEKGSTLTFDVKGETHRDLFKIHIYHGKVNGYKYNIGAQIKKNGILLLELHINPSNKHMNPDGTIVCSSHWHIYSEKYGRKIAFPAEDINSKDFVETTIKFLDKFNVIEKPEVQFQYEIM